jgi:hypothetical protein
MSANMLRPSLSNAKTRRPAYSGAGGRTSPSFLRDPWAFIPPSTSHRPVLPRSIRPTPPPPRRRKTNSTSREHVVWVHCQAHDANLHFAPTP